MPGVQKNYFRTLCDSYHPDYISRVHVSLIFTITVRHFLDWIEWNQTEMEKSDQHSKVSLDIKVLTLVLKIAPQSSLLGHNAFVIDIVQLQKTYGLTTSSLTTTSYFHAYPDLGPTA